MYIYLDLPNDAKFLLFQKLLLFWGTCIFFCLRAFFGFGTFWGTWTSHHGADKHLKRRNFPSKKHNFPPKKHKNKSGWQAFPSSQNPKHETALLLEKSKKYLKQQKKNLFQLRAIISHNRKFQVYIYLGVQAGRSFNGLSGDKKNISVVGISFMINNSKGPINLMIFELQGIYDMFTYGNHLDLQQNPGLG